MYSHIKGELRRWKPFLGAFLTAGLLLPIPAYASITWVTGSNWTITTGSTTQNVNTSTGYGAVPLEPNWLFIQPTTFVDTTTSITLQREFLAQPSSSVTATALLSNIHITAGSVQMAVWVTWTTNGTPHEADIFGTSSSLFTVPTNNMFATDQTGRTPVLLAAGPTYTLHVEFQINSTSWSMPTPSQVVFQFNNP